MSMHKSMAIVLAFLLCLVVLGCSAPESSTPVPIPASPVTAPTYAPQPTYTALPTYTPLPTFTPLREPTDVPPPADTPLPRQQPTDTPAPQSGGLSASSDVVEYLSWYVENGTPLILDMNQTMNELTDLASNYDILGMCQLQWSDPTRFQLQLSTRPVPDRVMTVRDETLRLFSEWKQCKSDTDAFCSTFDSDALVKAAGHANAIASILKRITSELDTLAAEYNVEGL
jgi:hypothetical protein